MASIGGNMAPSGRTAMNGLDDARETTLKVPSKASSYPPIERSSETKHYPVEDSDGIFRIGGKDVTIPRNFKKFDPTSIREFLGRKGTAGIIYGRRGTGKTTLLKDLIYHNRKEWDTVHLFSLTAKLQEEHFFWIPSHHKYTSYDDGALTRILEEQKKDVEMKIKNKQEKAIKNILIVFDDIIAEDKIRHSQIFNLLFTTGRHYHISPIILTQAIGGANGVPKIARDNVDFCIGFCAHNQIDRELVSERYLSTIHKKIGEEIYKNITSEPYTALVALVGISNIRKYEDFIYSYSAPIKTPKFIIGKELEKDGTFQTTDNTVRIPHIPVGIEGVLISYD